MLVRYLILVENKDTNSVDIEYTCSGHLYYTTGRICQKHSCTHQSQFFFIDIVFALYSHLVILQELRKKFEKSSDDVDSALSKYMSKKPKDPTLHEV